jgi:hypothetical protein
MISSGSKMVALGLMILFALYSNLRAINREMKRFFYTQERVYEQDRDRHFAKLKEMLPRSGLVGYVSDPAPEANQEAMNDFYLAEYALCPLIVVRDATLPFVIAECKKTSNGNCFINPGSVPLKEFGNGLILYHQKQK